MIKKCTSCGDSFECKEGTKCWCFKEPGLKQDQIKYDDCVCKNCLKIQYRKRLVGI